MNSLDSLPREIGKFTAEQLTQEREARAAREEIFRRICDEAKATASTFEQAAAHLGLSHHAVDYFQADREIARAAWEKISSNESGHSLQRQENILRAGVRQLKTFLRVLPKPRVFRILQSLKTESLPHRLLRSMIVIDSPFPGGPNPEIRAANFLRVCIVFRRRSR